MKIKSFALDFVYVWLIVFSFVPLLMIAVASVLSKDSTHLLTLPFTLENYHQLLTSAFARIIARSLFAAIATTVCCLVLAFPFSYILIKSKYKSILLLFIIIPFWTSSLVRTYSLLSLLKFNGIINILLLKLHLIEQPLNLLYSQFAVLVGLVYTLFPFMVLPIITHMDRFDFRLMEAGKDLGANRWILFSKVFLPNTLTGIKTGCTLVFLPAMTLFYIPNILGGARSILLGNLIQNQFLVAENWPEGAATSMLLTLSLVALYAFYHRPTKTPGPPIDIRNKLRGNSSTALSTSSTREKNGGNSWKEIMP